MTILLMMEKYLVTGFCSESRATAVHSTTWDVLGSLLERHYSAFACPHGYIQLL